MSKLEIDRDWLGGWIDALDDADPAKAQLRALLDYAEQQDAMLERREALAAIDKAWKKLEALCRGDERWRMSIPAEPDNDPDLVIVNALHKARRILSRTSDEGDQRVAEAVRYYADELDRAIAEQGGQRVPDADKYWRSFAERAVTILHNMAMENSGRFRIRRWPISDEPLRNDAARLLREYGLGHVLPEGRQYVGDEAAAPQPEQEGE